MLRSTSPRIPRLVAILALLVVLLPEAGLAQRIRPLAGCSGLQITTSPTGVTQHANSGSYAQSFTVYNCGSTSVNSITLSCQSWGPVGCVGVSPTFRASLAAGASFNVSLTYSVGDPGIGQAQLWANWGDDFTAFGALGVTVDGPPAIVLIPTETGPATRAVVHNRTPVIRARVSAQYSAIDSTKSLLKWGNDTVTRWRSDSFTVARWNRGLIEWEVDSLRGLNGAGADSVLVTAKACAVNTLCTTVTRWVVLPADNAPLLGLTALPVETSGGFGAPFGPGLSVSGAEIETGFATVPYFSMGLPRSAGLVYSTRQSYPRVLVPLDVELRWPAGNPTDMVVRLFDGAVKLDSLKLANPTCATGTARRCRVVLQGDFSGSTFPVPTRKWLKVEVAVTSGSVVTASDSVEAVLVDRRQTAYGSGWWPTALFELVAAGEDRILVAPNGSWTVYRGNGDSLYLPPPGNFVFLTQTASGWELRARGDSAVTRFDSYGRVAASVDRNGNRDSLAYGLGGLDTLKKVRDATGHEMTFTYTSGKLSSITDAAGRETRITVNGSNQLTYDSLSSPSSRSVTAAYGYQAFPGTNTVLLTRRISIRDTTTIVYDSTFKRRPRQAVLPTVRDPADALVNPTITYTAVESRGFGGLVRVDSAGPYVEMKDPRGNWTRSWLNRWGQVRLSWDTLGILNRTAYHPDGFVRYSEGKNGDSSRVYTSYDDQRRPVKTYIVRGSPSNVLRTDSLVYDASHRVTQRIDARGKVSKYFPDARGRDTMTVTPNSDTTRYAYNANGTLASVRAPGDTGKTRQYYDATWSNLTMVTTPHGDTVVNTTFDGTGRATASTRKVIVQTADETPGTTGLQWRRTETFYTVANEVDSTRMSRSDTCTGVRCTVPGTWSWDSLHSMRVGMRYDRAGRDSVRVTGPGRETLYQYDRLGRLVSRRPPSDSTTPPRDSLVYDVAGNLVRAISRRGDTTLVYYDTRNRDTATVTPGVGTRRKAFLGPQDQLTRIWIDSPVDSIGGVNGEVRFGYDSRGRLRADTAYRGSTAVATTHAYDTFERDSVMTDPLGASTFGYEANRGYLTQIIAAIGDTLYYVYDKRGRVTGPAVWRNGIKTKVGQFWNLDGALTGLADSSWGTGPFEVGRYGERVIRDDGGVARLPLWLQRQNSFGSWPTDTLEDTPVYDGWERLTQWTQKKNGTQIASYSYSFDQYGNLYTPSGGELYGAATDRLLRRTDPVTGHIWSYGYDRNGNQVSARDSTPGGGVLVWTYGYNGLNQLVSVRRSGISGAVARYAYDVLGRRIVKRVYSTATGGTQQYLRMVYHGDQVAFETDSAGTVGWKYVWGIGTDRLLVAQNGASVYWVSTDKLGSIRAVTTPSWQQFQWHTPYAEVTTVEGTSAGLRYGWTGREYDAETGQYFHRARYYSPGQRRFVQEDPIGTNGGPNLFAYVGGAVLEARDPAGTSPEDPPLPPVTTGCSVYSIAACSGATYYLDGVPITAGLGGSLAAGGAGLVVRDITNAFVDGIWQRQQAIAARDRHWRQCNQNPACRDAVEELRGLGLEYGLVPIDGDPTMLPGNCQGKEPCSVRGTQGAQQLWITFYTALTLEKLQVPGTMFGRPSMLPTDGATMMTHEIGHAIYSIRGGPQGLSDMTAISYENNARNWYPGYYGTRAFHN